MAGPTSSVNASSKPADELQLAYGPISQDLAQLVHHHQSRHPAVIGTGGGIIETMPAEASDARSLV